jgi:hypothetical protein
VERRSGFSVIDRANFKNSRRHKLTVDGFKAAPMVRLSRKHAKSPHLRVDALILGTVTHFRRSMVTIIIVGGHGRNVGAAKGRSPRKGLR